MLIALVSILGILIFSLFDFTRNFLEFNYHKLNSEVLEKGKRPSLAQVAKTPYGRNLWKSLKEMSKFDICLEWMEFGKIIPGFCFLLLLFQFYFSEKKP